MNRRKYLLGLQELDWVNLWHFRAVKAVTHVFGVHAFITGFYSTGEIGPYAESGSCQLYNEIMPIPCVSD